MSAAPLRSIELEAAIVGVAALQQAERALSFRPSLSGFALPDLALPALPGLPGLPGLPDVPELTGAGAALLRGWEGMSAQVAHAVSGFLPGPSGLWVPAAPALIGQTSPMPAAGSGPDAGRSRDGRGWAEAIDQEGLIAFLRTRHPLKPAEHVAELTGEPVSTVRKWLKGETRPSFRATLVLVCVYGPDLLTAALQREPEWFAAIRSGADRLRLAGELAEMRARIDHVLGPQGAPA